MKILLINPNTSTHVTDRMVAQARRSAGSRAIVEGATAAFGPAIIGSRIENAIALHGALDVAAREAQDARAIIMGVSMDTALLEMRELMPVPVVGMAEAALTMASCLGRRIGCLTIGAQMLPLYEEMTRSYGFGDRAIWRAMDLPGAFTVVPKPEIAEAVSHASERMARQDGADVVLLCGAVLTGYAERISAEVSIPVVDCIDAATRMAIALVERAEACPGPPPRRLSGRESRGLGVDLMRLLKGT